MEKTGKTEKEKVEAYDRMVAYLNWYRGYTEKKLAALAVGDNEFHMGLITGKADAIDFLFSELNMLNCI